MDKIKWTVTVAIVMPMPSLIWIKMCHIIYNIRETDALSQHYEYPDLSTTILDESNIIIYDSIDSH